MPWQNNGDYYSYKQESIAQNAPTVSGVYGLFNFRHQIVIGSAANVRNALLHHRRYTKFRFSRFEPSGFTFEICPAERRENRAQELIKEYNPISSPQTPIGLATLYRSWRAPQAGAFKAAVPPGRKPANKKIVAIHVKAEPKTPLHLNAERFGIAGAFGGVIFLVVGLIGLVPHFKAMLESLVRNSTASAESRPHVGSGKIPLTQAEIRNPTESTDNTVVVATPAAVVQSTPVNLDSHATSSSPTGWRSAAAQAAAPAPAATPTPQTLASAQPAKREVPANDWSVQVMATTDKKLASDWLQKLQAKGYQAFVIDADINGKTWQRVRIGAFATRRDAENLRAVLIANEGLRDAYVAGNDNPSTNVALNRR